MAGLALRNQQEAALRYIVDTLRTNPMRVRAVVLAVLTLVGFLVPDLAGIETNDAIVGGILAVLALVFGWGRTEPSRPDADADDADGR